MCATRVAEPRCSGAETKGGVEGARVAREDVISQVPVFFYTAEGADEEAVREGGDVQCGVQRGGELGGRAERDGRVREVRTEGEGVDGVGDAREGAVGVGVRGEVREDEELEFGREGGEG